ncbi:galaxin-like isoform X2 [Pygocentrus nattereri]|uniref:galaxin-like isoform X2 n=1 Tax=Pygocentrus nattereri TaxID=42514 RepID=UPI0008142B6B|nr:galaxin-like isoform X2 [Pygocentrus nattereri]
MRCWMFYYAGGIILCFWTSFSTQKSSHWCAGFSIDLNKYTCCSGTIHKTPHLSCCGKSAYNILESSCCLNELTLGLSQTVSNCCGSKAYNPLNQICCGGNVLLRKSAQNKCCGSELYEERTHLCCGPHPKKVLLSKKTSHDLCCGTELYNPIKQCCCYDLQVISVDSITSKCCLNQALLTGPTSPHLENQTAYFDEQRLTGKHSAGHSEPQRQVRRKKTSGLAPFDSQYCGQQLYDPHTSTCCSGKLFPNNAGLTQCCGEKSYELSEEGVLCCDGQLYHDQPADSTCAGNVPYSPHNYTICQKAAHLPAGQQCCGMKTFDPNVEICCNGHRHKRSAADTACCGIYAYSARAGRHKCCSGQLLDVSFLKNKEEAGCCGPLLLTDRRNQQCCHSAQKTLAYKTQPSHSCCGHWYYNTSIWSCCAGRLIPAPTNRTGTQAGEEEFILRPWMDYNSFPICSMTVMLGTVKSSAVKGNQRFVVLTNAMKIQGKRCIVTAQEDSFLVGPLDHCSTPALKQNRTYLWRKISGHHYKPLSDVPNLTAALHAIMTFCQSMTRD